MFFRTAASCSCDARESTLIPTRIPHDQKPHSKLTSLATSPASSSQQTPVSSSTPSECIPNSPINETNEKSLTPAILVFNIQGMDPSINSKGHYKLPYLKSYMELENTDYLAIAITDNLVLAMLKYILITINPFDLIEQKELEVVLYSI